MALLTADDVYSKRFKVTKHKEEGYDQDEVDDFLDLIVSSMQESQNIQAELNNELADARNRIAELEAELEQARSAAPAEAASAAGPFDSPFAALNEQPEAVATPEPVVSTEPEAATGILSLAQKLHDDYVNSGKDEGDRLRTEGEAERDRLVSEARAESERIVSEAQKTSSETLNRLEVDRSVLERKIEELRDFERNYRNRLTGYLQSLLSDVEEKQNEPEGNNTGNNAGFGY